MARKLDVSNASATVVQPIKAGTLTFLQAAWAAGLNDICASLLGIDSTTTATTAYVLYGCVGNIIGTTPATITAGAIIFNGEIYEVPASTITYGGGQVAICNIVTTQDTPDPTTFSNQIPYQVHDIRTIVISAGTSGAGTVCDFGALVYDLKSIPQILSQVVNNDLTLQGNINAEVNRAEAAEAGLQADIDTINQAWEGVDTTAGHMTINGGTASASSVNVTWHVGASKTCIVNYIFTFVASSSGIKGFTYASGTGPSIKSSSAITDTLILFGPDPDYVGGYVILSSGALQFSVTINPGNAITSGHTYTVKGQFILQTN